MRKKGISIVLIALIVALGVPTSVSAANTTSAEAMTKVKEGISTTEKIEIVKENSENTVAETSDKGSKEDNNSTSTSDSNLPVHDSMDKGNIADTKEESAIEPPATEETVTTAPTINVEKPLVEDSVVEEPVIKDPAGEQPSIEVPVIEEPGVEEPVVEEPGVEQPTTTESAVVVEEPVTTEPAIVVEELVTEPAIVVEPATLKIVYHGEYMGKESSIEEIVEGYKIGETVDLSEYINKMIVDDGIVYKGQFTSITIDQAEMLVSLEYIYDTNLIASESQLELLN